MMTENLPFRTGQWLWDTSPLLQRESLGAPFSLEVIVPVGQGRAGESGVRDCEQLWYYSEFSSIPLAGMTCLIVSPSGRNKR